MHLELAGVSEWLSLSFAMPRPNTQLLHRDRSVVGSVSGRRDDGKKCSLLELTLRWMYGHSEEGVSMTTAWLNPIFIVSRTRLSPRRPEARGRPGRRTRTQDGFSLNTERRAPSFWPRPLQYAADQTRRLSSVCDRWKIRDNQ